MRVNTTDAKLRRVKRREYIFYQDIFMEITSMITLCLFPTYSETTSNNFKYQDLTKIVLCVILTGNPTLLCYSRSDHNLMHVVSYLIAEVYSLCGIHIFAHFLR